MKKNKNPCPPGCPGWVTFGSHVDSIYKGQLDFNEDDESGMPKYEKHTSKEKL